MDSLAARLGDHHVCPQHGGGDVLPSCASTILIAGEPAARETDGTECVGGVLDVIKQGEPTVLLEGKPAARLGDPTLHGGLLDQGCPTVIIGKMSADAKRERLMERLRLIDDARNKAMSMPPGREKDALTSAADRLARDNRAVESARLANDVYQDSGAPEGWHRLTPDELPPELRNATFDSWTGFHAAIYRSDIDGSYALTYRGTQASSWQDWVMGNVSQGAGAPSPQYAQAVALARQVHDVYGSNMRITGHSLGGGLASAGSLASGVPADTFDPAGLNAKSYLYYGLNPFDANRLIDAYRTKGDPLTTAQDWTPAPDAVGKVHTLEAMDTTTGPDGQPVFTHRPGPLPSLPSPGDVLDAVKKITPGGVFGALKKLPGAIKKLPGEIKKLPGEVMDGAGKVGGAILQRHSLEDVITGLEYEKSQDIATIKGMP